MLVKKHLEHKLQKILGSTDERGYLTARESTSLEYKESFSAASFPNYAKIFASFANAHGGYIVFGVKNSPRQPIGIKRKKFDEIEQEKITSFLSSYFSPQMDWEVGTFKLDSIWLGYFYVYESQEKPVICKQNNGSDLKEGGIYFRYRGQSKLIGFPELKAIYNEIRDQERKLWLSHIKNIGKIGPKNVALLDLVDGEIQSDNLPNRFILDESLLDRIRSKMVFIEEGNFSEIEGDPTLKIVGAIETSDYVVSPKLDPNRDYPFVMSHLADELQIRPYDVQILLWKLELQDNPKYCAHINTGKKSKTKKYSVYTLKKLKEALLEYEDNISTYLKKVSRDYNDARKRK